MGRLPYFNIDTACACHPLAEKQLADMRKVIEAAKGCVGGPYSNFRERMERLEQTLKEGGWL